MSRLFNYFIYLWLSFPQTCFEYLLIVMSLFDIFKLHVISITLCSFCYHGLEGITIVYHYVNVGIQIVCVVHVGVQIVCVVHVGVQIVCVVHVGVHIVNMFFSFT